MIPLAVPNLNGNERKFLNKCIDTTFVSSVGEFVNKLEEKTAEICGTKYAVATSAGTTGLHLALIGVGVEPGNLVIIPSFTFIATANAVAHCGAMPWLMDINEDSWTIDCNKLEQELTENTLFDGEKLIHKSTGKRVAAIMPVYTLGYMPDMKSIRKIADQYHLPLIADAACAIGAMYNGHKLGELADLSVISFNGNKTVTTGGGGMVVGNDGDLMSKIRHISTTARVNAEYDFDMVGYNYRMTNIQAAVGCAQLERLETFIERKRYVRSFYYEQLKGVNGISFFPDPKDQYYTCWFSGIVLEEGGLPIIRDICGQLKLMGIEARSFWKPVHFQEPYRMAPKAEDMRITENVWDRILTLPCSTGITDGELETVVKCVSKIFS